MSLFHHHESERGANKAASQGGAKPAGDNTKMRGIIVGVEPADADHGMVRVAVTVRLRDGSDVQFTEELANLYQPPPGSPEAQRLAEMREAQHIGHPTRIPKIQLPLQAGGWVPVRYHPSNRKKFVLDQAALQSKALDDYIDRGTKPAQPKTVPAAGTGPPWEVPSECPMCGAPVDQAVASKEADPKCEFCREPIPVKPRGVS